METEGGIYTTETGVELRVGRIPRQSIDRFIAAHPPPEPPTVEVETWAGDTEEVLDHDAPEYRQAMTAYYAATGYAQLELIAGAVEIVDASAPELADLQSLGIATDKASFLRHVLVQSGADLEAVTEAVFYNSTVTPRGIMEAAELFGVTWRGKQVNPFAGAKSSGKANGAFNHRQAAELSGYNWTEFCQMDGQEQSEIVCFRLLSARLNILQQRRRGKT